jgi:hypothetical protein
MDHLSIEGEIPHASSSKTPDGVSPKATRIPLMVVEYVKTEINCSEGEALHENHLAAAMSLATRLYGFLELDFPVFGLLVNRYNITFYAAHGVCNEVGSSVRNHSNRPTYLL